MKSGLFDLFSAFSGKLSILEWLDMSSFDELVEVNVLSNRYRILARVDDKFADAPETGAFSDLYQFVLDNLVHPDDYEAYAQFMDPETLLSRLRAPGKTGTVSALVNQMRFKVEDGSWRWVEMCLVDGEQYGLGAGVVRQYTFDVQVQKNYEGRQDGETAGMQPDREKKTGLFWGIPFFERAMEIYAEVNAEGWCAIVVDIEHFGLLNDWYGRTTGDMLLARIGEVMGEAERASGGVAGYLGQDDFSLIAPHDEKHIAELYSRLSDLIAELATSIGFKPVFGVAIDDGHTPFIELFDQARVALDVARGDFKTNICYYDASMRVQGEKEYRILLDFQRALKEGEFSIYLQPQCRISTGQIVGVEALARWIKPDGTIVPTDDFIPVLERNGFVTDLDCFVWEEACALMREWLDKGYNVVPISLNVSQNDFYAIDVVEYFAQLISRYQVPSSLLKIEITESAFAESESSIEEAIKLLREMGLMVLLDDFGAGYSSLNRLGSLNIDVIKLDAAFFKMDEEHKRKSIRIVESIVSMAKIMSLPIICEGVEAIDQVDFLASLGCQYIQGFYFYQPMSAASFEPLIVSGTMIDNQGFVVKHNDQLQLKEFMNETIYSDSMLNTILGPVAYYLWRDDSISVIRFNEQFYELDGTDGFEDRMGCIQRFVAPDDEAKLLALFEKAISDQLNGAYDVIGFFKGDGSLARYAMRVYYLGENADGKRFYGSLRDVTEIAEIQIQLKMLSNHLPVSVVFMRRMGDRWDQKLIVHGLSDEMGLTYDQFQQEIHDRSLFQRVDRDDYERIREALEEAVAAGDDVSDALTLRGGDGGRRRFRLDVEHVDDPIGEGSCFLKLSSL